MFERFLRRRGAASTAALKGAPPIRRQKSYSAQTGYVYQYFYEGYREGDREGRPGNEYVFNVSSDRKSSFPLTVFLADSVVQGWEQGHGRLLTVTEHYAAVKMALFQAFDDRADLGPANAEVEIDPHAMEIHLATLEIE